MFYHTKEEEITRLFDLTKVLLYYFNIKLFYEACIMPRVLWV